MRKSQEVNVAPKVLINVVLKESHDKENLALCTM